MIEIDKTSLMECDFADEECFNNWGVDDVAYLKRDVVDNTSVWSIFNAEGLHMGYAADRSIALAVISQNDLTPMSVH